MNKTDLVNYIAEKSDISRKDAENALNATIGAITEALASNDIVALAGFGSFSVKAKPARIGRNPKTGEKLEIKASNAPVFKPGKALKESVK